MTATIPRRTRRTALPDPSPDWAYFLDLDGTLLEFDRVPADVSVDAKLRDTIVRLAARTGGAVAIITGRPIREVDRLFPGLVLAAAGQHGLERRTANGVSRRTSTIDARLDAARTKLRGIATRYPAFLVEDKGLSLALHYRQSPTLASYAHRLMRDLQFTLGAAYVVQGGKRVVELKPAGRDKGVAIREFMSEAPFYARRPVFIGDDVTDEYAFDVINELGGISVKVGSGRTRAAWKVRDVTAVRRWLSLAATPRQ